MLARPRRKRRNAQNSKAQRLPTTRAGGVAFHPWSTVDGRASAHPASHQQLCVACRGVTIPNCHHQPDQRVPCRGGGQGRAVLLTDGRVTAWLRHGRGHQGECLNGGTPADRRVPGLGDAKGCPRRHAPHGPWMEKSLRHADGFHESAGGPDPAEVQRQWQDVKRREAELKLLAVIHRLVRLFTARGGDDAHRRPRHERRLHRRPALE